MGISDTKCIMNLSIMIYHNSTNVLNVLGLDCYGTSLFYTVAVLLKCHYKSAISVSYVYFTGNSPTTYLDSRHVYSPLQGEIFIDSSFSVSWECQRGQTPCPNGLCIGEGMLCDGNNDCWDNTDETQYCGEYYSCVKQ